MSDEKQTMRLLMFEVYEDGQGFPTLVTSDEYEARAAAPSGNDRIVERYWVAEGRAEQ